jgi:cytoskeletal protein CcmA (bactofilin family)
MIGAGMRVDGHVVFTGVLRVQGDVVGNVACQGDAGDAVVVDATGSVTGAVGAPRIVVRGRVLGPLRSAQSIDIQPGGSVVGDAFYKQIVIHAGGFVEGALMPVLPIDAVPEACARQALQAGAPDLSPSVAGTTPADGGGSLVVRRIGGWGVLGGAALLAIAVAAGVWMSRPPATPKPPAADAAAQDVAAPPSAARAAAEPAASPAPAENAAARAPAQPASPAPPAAGAEEVVTVQGVNPAKPAGAFLLISKEPSVLYRKKREEAGEGTRFVVQQGKTVSVAIGRNELFRVAEGRDLEIFYQGRKVNQKAIENGAWMSFVPSPPATAGEDRPAESEDGAAR